MSNFAEWLNSVTVLYVGDGKSTQAGWLESAGAQVLTAASAEEARSACEKDPTAIDAAVVEADYSGAGWLGVARDLPGSCALLVIANDVEPSLLEKIVTDRGYSLAEEIDALRDTPVKDASTKDAGVPLDFGSKEQA